VRSELWRDFAAAVSCLTGLRLSTQSPSRERIGRATLFFPVVGAMVGGAVAGCAHLLTGVVSRSSLGVVCALLMVVLSRGLGVGGVGAVAAESCRTVRGGEMVRRRGAFAAAVLTILASKVVALAVTAESLVGYAVFLAAVLGHWAPVVLAHGARPVRVDASDPLAVGRVGSREFAWSSAVAIGASLAAADALGLLAVLAAAVTSTGLRICAYRTRGEMTATLLAASIELVELVVLAVFAGISAPVGR
jgi:adenosylcobinamide-GDP ribazoletransferase